MPSSTPPPAPASSVTLDTTFGIPLDTRPAVTDNWSHSALSPTFCVTEDTSSLAVGTAPHSLNPLAPLFDPPSREAAQTEIKPDDDELPAHINLLYETTVAHTRLSADVDKQFWNVFRRCAATFAKDSTDLGFCPVLLHDVETGDSPPIKQFPRRPPLSAGNAEDEIFDDMLKTGVNQGSICPKSSGGPSLPLPSLLPSPSLPSPSLPFPLSFPPFFLFFLSLPFPRPPSHFPPFPYK